MHQPATALLSVVLLAAGLAAADADYGPGGGKPSTPPMLGVEMSPVPTSVQERLGIDSHTGVMVQEVFGNTAAQGMGIQRGDVITQINGQPINSMMDLRNEVGSSATGDPVNVVVRRGDQELHLSDTLKEWPAQIPKEPIDSAAEKRFRDYQAQRAKRQVDQLAETSQQAAALADDLAKLKNEPLREGELAGARGAGEAPLAARPESSSSSRRPWRLTATAQVASVGQPLAAPAADLHPVGGAWRLRMSSR
jgi:membrane-associated protease RseP (regulator of RpoE activity)